MDAIRNFRVRQICQTGEESWIELPVRVCILCGIGIKKVCGMTAKRRGDFVYLQGEDAADMAELKLEQCGILPYYTQWSVDDFNAWLKGDSWPNARRWRVSDG